MSTEAERFLDRPRPECKLALNYLTGERRMVRMEETLEPYTVRHGRMTIEIDVALPDDGDEDRAEGHWLIPVVYLEKRPVAPDLVVLDAEARVVSVPTKHENQEITLAALQHLHDRELFDLAAHPELRAIVGDIVCMRPGVAEVATLQLYERLPDPPEPLERLLAKLGDNFLLWIPVKGEPGSVHHFSIRRRQPRLYPAVFPRKGKIVDGTIETAIGPEKVVYVGPFGRRTIVLSEIVERTLRMLGLAPISVTEHFQEACRVDSYHAKLISPPDFVVREARLGCLHTNRPEPGDRRIEELQDEPNQTIQGHESELAHVHCVRRQDRAPLMLEVLLGVRDGLTTLWVLGVMMTAVVLRIFRHDIGPATEKGHLEVAAAVLLLGPALAAAWAVRSDDGHLLRNVLSGTRQLLMASALLSVAAALALIGYVPLGLSQVHAIEWYASVAYAIAVVVVISWSITRRSPWVFYRQLLQSTRRNLWATVIGALLVGALLVHPNLPDWLCGVCLLGLGVALACISANRVGVEMGAGSRPFAAPAFLASTVAFLAAGALLGYYEDAVGEQALRLVACGLEAALALWAMVLALSTSRSFDGGRLTV